MGDLRNKMAKQAWTEAHERLLAQLCPSRAPDPPIRCRCGHTIYQTTIWAHCPGWKRPVEFYCAACMPADVARS